MISTSTLSDRRGLWAFILGVILVTGGVLMHAPMFLMGRHNHFVLAGMPIGWDMIAGMAGIVGGCGIAAYGLLPRNIGRQLAASQDIVVSPPEDAPLGRAHWMLMSVLVIALIIDIMKPATLGFTLSGMMSEYDVSKSTVSAFPFSALAGTVVGSIIWGVLADIYGRKATILLSAVMFVGTSICGAMPSLAWNVGMCFMMGVAAGGMLPVTYALLAEMMPSKHRGWALVLVGGLGAAGGYFAASGFSAVLQPFFGWRVLWILNLPTGLSLVLLGSLIPESAKFLLARGRTEEAQRVMQRFGSTARQTRVAEHVALDRGPSVALTGSAFFGTLFALSLAAICFSLINFGLLLWLPADLIEKGYSVGLSSRLLAESALIAFPTVFIVAYLYSRWSTKWSVVGSIVLTLAGLAGVLALEFGMLPSPVFPVALLIIGTNALIAMLLPYAAESFPLRIRGRTTGIVAACTKAGGMVAQFIAMFALVPPLGVVSIVIIVPTVAALFLVAWFGKETRGRDLRDLDPDARTFAASGM
ncbi:MAG TPA: MFS transporter [Sphingomicrobium sp.]|nr:MFS transporter [Sphingomicrobium sp.]